MEIQQLRHLLAAAENSSYAQAAKKCFTSRQNVAHSVKAIENELDVTLFEHKGNGIALTPVGRQVAHQAGEIIAKVDNLHVMFASSDLYDAGFNLAVSTNLFAGIPSSTDAFFAEHSDKLRYSEFSCEECYKSACAGKSNVAVIMCMERKFPDCNAVEIASSVSYVLMDASSELAQKKSLVAADLKDQKLMLMSKPVFQYESLFAQLDSMGFDRANVGVVPSTSTMIHMMKRHGGMGIVSGRFATDPPKGVVAIPFSDSQLHWRFYVLYRTSGINSRSVMKLTQDIRSTFKGCGLDDRF